MSTGDVHQNDMPAFPDDQWPADDPALAAFAEDLRIIAAGPAPEPRPGLVTVMRQGAVPVQSPAPGSRKKMLVKTFVGGLAAKVALGSGLAAASVTMAGAAGVLPEPARDVVASVVAAATPFELPDPSVNLQVGGDDPSSSTSTSSSTTTTVAGDDDSTDGGTTDRKVNHGACVSAAARDKAGTQTGGDANAHGKTVSSIARSDCGKEQKGSGSTTSTTVGSTSSSSSSTSSTVAGGQRSADSGSGSGNSGKNGNSGKGNGNSGNAGNGNGNSSGNSGKGNSGKN